MGLTGLEPVTLRLSSACSNQLSYRPRFPEVNSEQRSVIGQGIRVIFLITDHGSLVARPEDRPPSLKLRRDSLNSPL